MSDFHKISRVIGFNVQKILTHHNLSTALSLGLILESNYGLFKTVTLEKSMAKRYFFHDLLRNYSSYES